MTTPRDLADLYPYPQTGRPWIRTNFVSSVDGAVQDRRGVSGDLGGEADLRIFRVLRSLCDVVLVGAGTTRAEGYGPIPRDSIHPELRDGRAEVPLLAVVSRSLDIPESLRRPGVLVVTCADSPDSERERLAQQVEVLVAGGAQIDWPAVLDSFAARGLTRVLCEGGPRLHGTLLDHDLIDEACVTVSPHLIGGPTKRMTETSTFTERAMRLSHVVEDGNVLLTRWLRDR